MLQGWASTGPKQRRQRLRGKTHFLEAPAAHRETSRDELDWPREASETASPYKQAKHSEHTAQGASSKQKSWLCLKTLFQSTNTKINLHSRKVESEHPAQRFLFLLPKADLVTQLQKNPNNNSQQHISIYFPWQYFIFRQIYHHHLLSIFLLWKKPSKVLHYLLQEIAQLLNFSWFFIVNSKNYGQDCYEVFLFYLLCSSAQKTSGYLYCSAFSLNGTTDLQSAFCSTTVADQQAPATLCIYLSTREPNSQQTAPWVQMPAWCQQRERLSTSKYANLLFQYVEPSCNFSLSFTYSRGTQLPWPNNRGQLSNTASLQSTKFITSLRKH